MSINDRILSRAEQLRQSSQNDLEKARNSTDTAKVKHLARVQLLNAACAYGAFMDSCVHDYDLAMKFSDTLETAAIFFTYHK